jgi:hypothetical protein
MTVPVAAVIAVFGAITWLVLLVATNFNLVSVSLGLFALVIVLGQGS